MTCSEAICDIRRAASDAVFGTVLQIVHPTHSSANSGLSFVHGPIQILGHCCRFKSSCRTPPPTLQKSVCRPFAGQCLCQMQPRSEICGKRAALLNENASSAIAKPMTSACGGLRFASSRNHCRASSPFLSPEGRTHSSQAGVAQHNLPPAPPGISASGLSFPKSVSKEPRSLVRVIT